MADQTEIPEALADFYFRCACGCGREGYTLDVLPHLTAERDAEIERLRAELDQVRRDTRLGWEARHAAEADLDQVIEALGLDPESVVLEDVGERAETLAEWGKTAKAIFGPDTAPAAVLADPTPSAPEEGTHP